MRSTHQEDTLVLNVVSGHVSGRAAGELRRPKTLD